MVEFMESVIAVCSVIISFGIFLFLIGKGFSKWKETEQEFKNLDDEEEEED